MSDKIVKLEPRRKEATPEDTDFELQCGSCDNRTFVIRGSKDEEGDEFFAFVCCCCGTVAGIAISEGVELSNDDDSEFNET